MAFSFAVKLLAFASTAQADALAGEPADALAGELAPSATTLQQRKLIHWSYGGVIEDENYRHALTGGMLLSSSVITISFFMNLPSKKWKKGDYVQLFAITLQILSAILTFLIVYDITGMHSNDWLGAVFLTAYLISQPLLILGMKMTSSPYRPRSSPSLGMKMTSSSYRPRSSPRPVWGIVPDRSPEQRPVNFVSEGPTERGPVGYGGMPWNSIPPVYQAQAPTGMLKHAASS